ncbi:hypothetical protein F3Y22_tig00110387pilonHSYRG01069 [Hibiscus syriacus]|uniref:Uncharacterized protein n=1 Tax=Hibiscus syriacus TaxID=106335 RepID=A0A6A3ARA2_HIBSY|nr:hypothetical protein F3Y22_tig00110387pilonHSYRG01069 [Hibiscus syriacus]
MITAESYIDIGYRDSDPPPDMVFTVTFIFPHAASGTADMRLFSKLKRLKSKLKELNKSHFSYICGPVTAKRVQLEQLQVCNLFPPNCRRLEDERRVHTELLELATTESAFYRQKAKIHWLQDGDLSTRFFTNLIGSADPGVKGCSVGCLKELLNYSLPSGAEEALSRVISDAEIKEALFQHGKDKSPSPDDYTA